MPGYPIELELRGRTALVVGLGAVGRRKAAGLLEAGAHVIGVDPQVGSEARPVGVDLRTEAYHARHLSGVVLAIAAARPEVNQQVVADARSSGIWVCSTSDPADSDFIVPAVWREGPLLLTVSSGGASPALAAALRDRAAGALGPAASGFVTLLGEIRPEILSRLTDPEARRRLLVDWADPRWLELWILKGPEAVRRELFQRINAELGHQERTSETTS